MTPRPPRVIHRFDPLFKCGACGSFALQLLDYGAGYWRKECQTCGSTGPFVPADTAEPVTPQAGIVGAEPGGYDRHTVGHV